MDHDSEPKPMTLDALESSVLRFALAGEHRVLRVLREQLESVVVASREFTGVGFFVNLRVPAGCRRVGLRRAVISDIHASFEGLKHGAGFAVFVTDGALDFLEAFTYDEPWPAIPGKFDLQYFEADRHSQLAQLDG